ncbi:MAG: ribosomal RNA small subunit methyltransferase A [Spirochaetales bacterium]|nr:MAG: ribosomal RNA small subunit methyltransferase A [Spirochaetales bacterium]
MLGCMPPTSSSGAALSDTVPNPVDYNSPRELAGLLDRLGFAMRKRYGQNFLVAGSARKRILALLEAESGRRVWEVGPGAGAMSREALVSGLRLSTFEIDHGFASFMRESYGELPGFELFEGDFVKTWKQAVESSGAPERIFGNLPFNAAGAIIASIIEGGLRPPVMVFTVQKEAAQRMAAKTSTKNYASFTVLCQSAYSVKLAFDLPPGVFWPQPRVTSTVVIMRVRPDALPCAGEKAFTSFTRSAFASRRKTLRNNLKAAGWSDEEVAESGLAVGVSPDARAETLTAERFAALFGDLSTRRQNRIIQ